MARVTIGVPVYNSEALLEQSLGNLAAQTFPDFKVVILDNASTDGTAAIAERFAKQDPRFRYVRQSHNKGSRQNFVDALSFADTPYFMWRADDDISDANFIESLVHLLDETPSAALAVGRLVLDKRGRRRRKKFPVRQVFESRSLYALRLVLSSRAPWIYGLFRTEDLRARLTSVVAGYRHTIGFDYLVLFPFLLSGRVVGTNETSFTTGFVERGPMSPKRIIAPEEMVGLRRDFVNFCLRELSALTGGRLWSLLLRPIVYLYADRSYRSSKILHARLRVLAGDQPRRATSKYD